MDYREKLRDLLDVSDEKLREKLFKGKEDYFDTIEDNFKGFTNYYNSVVEFVVKTEIAMKTDDPDIRKTMISKADTSRKMKHDVAIDKCNGLNRLAAMMDKDTFCEIDTTDRYAVNSFVYDVCSSLYESEMSKYHSFEEALDNDVLEKIPEEKAHDVFEEMLNGTLEADNSDINQSNDMER